MSLLFKIKEIPTQGAPFTARRAVSRELLAEVLEAEQGDAAASKVEVEAELFREHDDVFVRGRLRGAFMLPCGRCLEPARIPVDVKLDAVFVREGQEPEDPADAEALLSSPDQFEHDGMSVVLDEVVRELLTAEIPISPLCRADCLGLCATCGANRNTPEGRACGHTAQEASPPSSNRGLAGLADFKLQS